ncbi:MAG: ComF family protein, partial [Alicyclobacillaceae bacterium]|nr:ComF family protein [Alicyclobacillaceae bacterium]
VLSRGVPVGEGGGVIPGGEKGHIGGNRWLRLGIDFLWPPESKCALCGRRGVLAEVRLPGVARVFRVPACNRCAFDLAARIPPPHCPGCGREVGVPGRCGDCRRRPLALSRVTAYGRYRGAVREAIHRVKFQRDERLLELLAGMLAAAWADLAPPPEAVLVPVPMHPDKVRDRGWNHVELIARGLGVAVGREVVPALARGGDPRSQATRGRRERFEALEGVFSAGMPEAVQGRAVVLIDDVWTTGATADACARALRAAGAREVYGLMVAR